MVNDLYKALIEYESFVNLLIDLPKVDRDIILQSIDDADQQRIESGQDVYECRTEFLKQMLEEVDEELERREGEESDV